MSIGQTNSPELLILIKIENEFLSSLKLYLLIFKKNWMSKQEEMGFLVCYMNNSLSQGKNIYYDFIIHQAVSNKLIEKVSNVGLKDAPSMQMYCSAAIAVIS